MESKKEKNGDKVLDNIFRSLPCERSREIGQSLQGYIETKKEEGK